MQSSQRHALPQLGERIYISSSLNRKLCLSEHLRQRSRRLQNISVLRLSNSCIVTKFLRFTTPSNHRIFWCPHDLSHTLLHHHVMFCVRCNILYVQNNKNFVSKNSEGNDTSHTAKMYSSVFHLIHESPKLADAATFQNVWQASCSAS